VFTGQYRFIAALYHSLVILGMDSGPVSARSSVETVSPIIVSTVKQCLATLS
jgi:hypothetical protein